MSYSGVKRYSIQAKRKNTKERWSEWTNVNDYEDAVRHARHVEELGYAAKIVVKDKTVEELRSIIGNSYEPAYAADALLDEGFRKESEVIREIMSEVDTLIGCHANGDIDDRNLYLLFEKLKKKYNYSEGFCKQSEVVIDE